MNALILDVRLDGIADPIGYLARDERGRLAFAYNPNYLQGAKPIALSISLPLTREVFDDPQARPFFDNLLQERDGVLTAVMARRNLSRDDVAGILFHIGRDCAGAVSVLPQGAPPSKSPGDPDRDYSPLSEDQMAAIVRALYDRSPLPAGMSDPSPLAGVQSKIALTILPDGRFAEPRRGSGAPTTHIIKAPDRNHPRDAFFEAAALDISETFGFPTAEARVLRIGEIDVLMITRFDRALNDKGHIVRLHQEDFAQALSLAPSLKYERNGNAQLRFDSAGIRTVLDHTIDPEGAREHFARLAIFDMLIGNVDGHAKNHALVHHLNGSVILGPRYDIMPTRLDNNLTDEFAFRIGSATRLKQVSTQDLRQFFTALGLREEVQQRILNQDIPEMANAFVSLFPELDRRRMKLFADMIAHNIDVLFANLQIQAPEAIASRDAFIEAGGGWS